MGFICKGLADAEVASLLTPQPVKAFLVKLSTVSAVLSVLNVALDDTGHV